MFKNPERKRMSEPPRPVLAKSGRQLEAPKPAELLSVALQRSNEAQDDVASADRRAGFLKNMLENPGQSVARLGREISDSAGKVYEVIKQKHTEWIDPDTDWDGMWKSAKSGLKRKLATLDDYATPICKEAGNAVKNVCAAIQKRIDNRK